MWTVSVCCAAAEQFCDCNGAVSGPRDNGDAETRAPSSKPRQVAPFGGDWNRPPQGSISLRTLGVDGSAKAMRGMVLCLVPGVQVQVQDCGHSAVHPLCAHAAARLWASFRKPEKSHKHLQPMVTFFVG